MVVTISHKLIPYNKGSFGSVMFELMVDGSFKSIRGDVLTAAQMD